MKKIAFVVIISLSLGGTGLFSGCQGKKDPVETAAETKGNPAPVAEKSGVNLSPTDSALVKETPGDTPASGGGQKFGYVNSGELIKLMPETKKAEASLQAYVKSLENEFGGLQTNYQKQISEFQAQEKTMVDAIKQTKIKAIQDLEQQMQQSQVSGQQKVAAKREQLFKPILDKAEKAVKEVGKENGYDYIFDASTGSFIYAKDSHDVMALVKTKLGIK